jgi:carbon monoxide dehydrogenase subunit G
MSETSRTFTVTPPPSVVLDYLADFSRAVDWDPGTEKCERLDSGPVSVGSRWHNTSKIAGRSVELTYTLKGRTPAQLVFVGENDSATSTDTIDVVPDGSGSRVTYTADVQMHGAAKLATPIIKLIFEKLGNETEDQMRRVLDGLS